MKNPGWKELALGGIIPEGGTAKEFETGDWRSRRPVWDANKCIHCLICWVYCPDGAVMVKESKFSGFDLQHCKGCGICARECPPRAKAITMMAEQEIRE